MDCTYPATASSPGGFQSPLSVSLVVGRHRNNKILRCLQPKPLNRPKVPVGIKISQALRLSWQELL